ncbi:uncharacterized protein LOC120327048 [Styela clava]
MLITITFAIILLGMGLATVYMLVKTQETQRFGNNGVDNKTLANLVQYIDEQREEINQLELKSAQEYLIKDAVLGAAEKYITVDGKLLWTGSAPGLTYDVAYNVCAKYWSTMAQIKNKQEYVAAMSMLRPKSGFIAVWIGLGINPLTGQIRPYNGFTKWYVGEPRVDKGCEICTKVSLVVRPDPLDDHQGMVNAEPNWTRDKVLCQL